MLTNTESVVKPRIKETNTIREVKEQISRLLGMTPEEQKIWSLNSNEEFEEQKILQKCGIKGDCAMAYK